MTLSEQVLDKLAKEIGREGEKDWWDFKEFNRVEVDYKDIEHAVVLALQLSQAEVMKTIDELESECDYEESKIFKDENFVIRCVLKEVRKRLLAKSEAKK